MKQTAIEWLIQELRGTDDKGDFIFQGVINSELIEQAKEMEKEQMVAFAEFVATYPDKNININGEMLHAKSKYDGAERTIDLLEIFIVP